MKTFEKVEQHLEPNEILCENYTYPLSSNFDRFLSEIFDCVFHPIRQKFGKRANT